MTHDIDAILKNPAAHGFEFLTETVRSGDAVYQGVPLIRVNDVQKFEATFPGLILQHLDGQSTRVGSQRVVREARDRNATIKFPELCRKLVEWLCGIRTVAARLVYGGPGGTKFATEAEAEAAWTAWADEKASKAIGADLE